MVVLPGAEIQNNSSYPGDNESAAETSILLDGTCGCKAMNMEEPPAVGQAPWGLTPCPH